MVSAPDFRTTGPLLARYQTAAKGCNSLYLEAELAWRMDLEQEVAGAEAKWKSVADRIGRASSTMTDQNSTLTEE